MRLAVIRECTLDKNTYVSDKSLQRLVPTSQQALHVSAVSEREVMRSFETLIKQGLGDARSSEQPVEMRPSSEDDLEPAHEQWTAEDQWLADVLLVLGWTGLRWAEARALRVEDVVELPTPGLIVRRSQPEGSATKSTKGHHSRRVPVALTGAADHHCGRGRQSGR